jgi:hypothetical protein
VVVDVPLLPLRIRPSPQPLVPAPPLLLLQSLLLLPPRNPGRYPRLFFSGELLELLAEAPQGESAVTMLAALFSRGRAYTTWKMNQPDAAFGHVLVLSTRSTRTKRLDPALSEKGIVILRDDE